MIVFILLTHRANRESVQNLILNRGGVEQSWRTRQPVTLGYAALRILGSIDIDPTRFSFGASRQSWPLITILNKALINIPPEDLHALTRGGSAGSSFDSTGPRQIALSTTLTVGMITAFLLLVVVYRRHLRYRQRMLGIVNAQRQFRHLAQRVSREKNAFLATMSHEIRTPIGAILGGGWNWS